MHGRIPSRKATPGGWNLGLAVRLAWRDLAGGLSGFRVFIACLALGVMALAAVGSTARGLTDGLAREGRRILGGDIAFSLVQREASAEERAFLDGLGRVNAVATLRAMANAGEKGAALVEVKAVDDAYPGVGALESDPAGTIPDLLGDRDGTFGAIVDPVLLGRLGLSVGDSVGIGAIRVRLRAELRSEPDKVAAGVGFGPRLIFSQAALNASGLLQPGSLVRWTYRVVLPESAAGDSQVAAAGETAKARFPEAGWNIRSRANAAPQVERNIERFTQFLTLVGLTALLIGGVGVANAVRRFVEVKRADFATLKALGAPGSRVVFIHFIEVMGVAALGVALGLVAGAALPWLAAKGLSGVLPLPFSPGFAPLELLAAALFGFLTAAVFAILPLGRAHDVPVSSLFRDQVEPERRLPRRRYLVMFGLLVAALLATALGLAYDRKVAALYVGAAGLIFLGLRGLALLFMTGVRALPRLRHPGLRLAFANMTRPGAPTPALVLSLGLGVALVSALSGIEASLSSQLRQGLPEKAPSFFFIDIPTAELDRFDGFIGRELPAATLERVPMMRGRIVALKGVGAQDLKAPEQVAWVLEGDRGLTYSTTAPEGSRLVAGDWWPADYKGEPLVSFDEEIARQLDLAIGDPVTVNVLGRNLTARIANLRRIEWRRLGINFVMVFSPNSFAGAPHTHLATVTLPGGNDAMRDAGVLKALARDFPFVTAVRVKDALDAVADITGKLSLAIRVASGLAILVGLLVLAGALAAGQRARLYDAVILKTLGATRWRLMSAYALEYGVVGLVSAVVGLGFGYGAGWTVVRRVMRLEFQPDVYVMSSIALSAITVAILFGLVGTWKILQQKPAAHLRSL